MIATISDAEAQSAEGQLARPSGSEGSDVGCEKGFMEREPDVTTGSVVSSDGTTIGFRCLGKDRAWSCCTRSERVAAHDQARTVLADAYTVFLPDRQGRGMSGPLGLNYSIEREDEDLAALVERIGAEYVFGPANGGLFALHGAVGLGQIRKVAGTNCYSCGADRNTPPSVRCSPRCKRSDPRWVPGRRDHVLDF